MSEVYVISVTNAADTSFNNTDDQEQNDVKEETLSDAKFPIPQHCKSPKNKFNILWEKNVMRLEKQELDFSQKDAMKQ